MRLHSPWNVPIHMPRVLIGSIADRRVTISFAALLVKVTARMPCGLTAPVLIRYAMRVVSTRVLPLPAPARISADWCGSVTALRCSGLRPESSEEFIRGLSHRITIGRFAPGLCDENRGSRLKNCVDCQPLLRRRKFPQWPKAEYEA